MNTHFKSNFDFPTYSWLDRKTHKKLISFKYSEESGIYKMTLNINAKKYTNSSISAETFDHMKNYIIRLQIKGYSKILVDIIGDKATIIISLDRAYSMSFETRVEKSLKKDQKNTLFFDTNEIINAFNSSRLLSTSDHTNIFMDRSRFLPYLNQA